MIQVSYPVRPQLLLVIAVEYGLKKDSRTGPCICSNQMTPSDVSLNTIHPLSL